MADMTQEELELAIDEAFDDVADHVFDSSLENQLATLDSTSDFRVSSGRLKAASETALASAPGGIRSAAFTSGIGRLDAYASDSGSGAALDADKVLEAADDEKKQAAAQGIRQLLCGRLREWFESNLEQVKTWLDELGIKGTLKRIWEVAKQLVVAAVTAVAGVVGSMFFAYLLLGLAVAAVGAAVYYVVKNGLPDYCAT